MKLRMVDNRIDAPRAICITGRFGRSSRGTVHGLTSGRTIRKLATYRAHTTSGVGSPGPSHFAAESRHAKNSPAAIIKAMPTKRCEGRGDEKAMAAPAIAWRTLPYPEYYLRRQSIATI